MARRVDRRVRLGIVVSGGLAGAGYLLHSVTRDSVPPVEVSGLNYLGFWLLVHAVLTFVALCAVALVGAVLGEDADDDTSRSDVPVVRSTGTGAGTRTPTTLEQRRAS